MITPTLETIEIDNVKKALKQLDKNWVTPDGDELTSKRAYNHIRKHLVEEGIYYRFTWPKGTKVGDVEDWFDHVDEVLKYRKLGLV